MMRFMNDEQIKEHFEEIQDALNEYKKQIDALREDLKIVIAFTHPNVVGQARQYARREGFQNPFANPLPDDLGLRDACGKFVEKYASLERPDL